LGTLPILILVLVLKSGLYENLAQIEMQQNSKKNGLRTDFKKLQKNCKIKVCTVIFWQQKLLWVGGQVQGVKSTTFNKVFLISIYYLIGIQVDEHKFSNRHPMMSL
jgi:hypothetical protein